MSPRKRRRALETLADAGQRGRTGATLLAHGCTVEILAGLVGDGLATVATEIVRARGRAIEIDRVRITDAGRRTIEGLA